VGRCPPRPSGSRPRGDLCLLVYVKLLNCLGSAIPARERVVVCEEVFELALRLPDAVAIQTRQPSLEGTGEVRLRRLVRDRSPGRAARLGAPDVARPGERSRPCSTGSTQAAGTARCCRVSIRACGSTPPRVPSRP